MRRITLVAGLALMGLGLAACQDLTGTTDQLTADEAMTLADAMVMNTFGTTGDVADDDAIVDAGDAAFDGVTSQTEFTTTRSCPAGGQVVLEGTRDREWDRETHTGSSDLSLTKTHQDCSRPLHDDVVITLNGAPNVTVEAHHAWEGWHRKGLQTLSLDGAIDWTTSDDRAGTCAIDLDVTFDPETGTRTVQGTLCSRTVDHTTTWHHDD